MSRSEHDFNVDAWDEYLIRQQRRAGLPGRQRPARWAWIGIALVIASCAGAPLMAYFLWRVPA